MALAMFARESICRTPSAGLPVEITILGFERVTREESENQVNKMISKSSRGFTLIELMIVVAIIGILAAIAIPNFLRFQLKSKTSEGKVNLAAIRTAEESYLAEFGLYVAAVPAPAAVPGTTKSLWPIPAPGFDTIGWGPEGAVFFMYAITVAGQGYTASADADLDGNTNAQAWAYAKPNAGARVAANAASACGVATLAADNQVGPCDSLLAGGGVFGQSEF
jgi:type IV pilus assembly protein PilA